MTIGKISIRPTLHFTEHHVNVDWEFVVATILSPTSTHPNARLGKDRFTYIKKYKKFSVEIHTKNDYEQETIWVINAFKNER